MVGFGTSSKFRYTGKVRPGKQSPKRNIPGSIARPDYADDGRPKAGGPMLPWQVEKKNAKDIEGMRAAGRVAREVLDAVGERACTNSWLRSAASARFYSDFVCHAITLIYFEPGGHPSHADFVESFGPMVLG